MSKWEFLTISVSRKSNGNIDFVLKRDDQMQSKAVYDEIDAYYNVSVDEWLAHLKGLRDDGWESVSVKVEDTEETHVLKRLIKGQ